MLRSLSRLPFPRGQACRAENDVAGPCVHQGGKHARAAVVISATQRACSLHGAGRAGGGETDTDRPAVAEAPLSHTSEFPSLQRLSSSRLGSGLQSADAECASLSGPQQRERLSVTSAEERLLQGVAGTWRGSRGGQCRQRAAWCTL